MEEEVKLEPQPKKDEDDKPIGFYKRKNTLTPRAPCIGPGFDLLNVRNFNTTTPQAARRATIPTIKIIETTCT